MRKQATRRATSVVLLALVVGASTLMADWGPWYSASPESAGVKYRVDVRTGHLCYVQMTAPKNIIQAVVNFRGAAGESLRDSTRNIARGYYDARVDRFWEIVNCAGVQSVTEARVSDEVK